MDHLTRLSSIRLLAAARTLAVAMSLVLASSVAAAERAPVLPFDLSEPDVAAVCVEDFLAAEEARALDDVEAAVDRLEAVAERCPESGMAWIRAASLHARAGRLDEAVESLRAAATLAPLPPGVSSDDAFEAIRASAPHAKRLAALPVSDTGSAAAQPLPAEETLARSREAIERRVTAARERIAGAGHLMTGIQHEAVDGAVALWEAASLDRLRERAEGSDERDRLRWEALRGLLIDDAWPRGGSVLEEILRRSEDPELLDSEHWVGAAQAGVMARWIRDGMESARGRMDPALLERLERDLLEIAAAAPDVPVLEPTLTLLLEIDSDDLRRGRRLYRRVLALAPDAEAREAARARMRARFPGVVASAEGVPQFATQTIDGRMVSNASLRGRPTLLQFWATWCPPCKKDLPALRELVERQPELRVIGIALEESTDADAFERSAEKLGITWPQVLEHASDAEMGSKFGASVIPEYVLLDASGTVASAGSRLAALRPAIERVLASGEAD